MSDEYLHTLNNQSHAAHFVKNRAALHKKCTGRDLNVTRIVDNIAYRRQYEKTKPTGFRAWQLRNNADKIPLPDNAIFRLPSEVRNMIYHYALAEPQKTFLLDTLIPPALCRVSRGIRYECLLIFLRSNHFCVLLMKHAKLRRYHVRLAPLTSLWLLKFDLEAPVLQNVSLSFSDQDARYWAHLNRNHPTLASRSCHYEKLMYHLRYDVTRRAVRFTHGYPDCRLCREELLPPHLGLFPHLPIRLLTWIKSNGIHELTKATSHHAEYMAQLDELCIGRFSSTGISVGQLSQFFGSFLEKNLAYLHRSSLTFNIIEATYHIVLGLEADARKFRWPTNRKAMNTFRRNLLSLEDFYAGNKHLP